MPRRRHARRAPRPHLQRPVVQAAGSGTAAFMDLVDQAIGRIPPEFRDRLENVAFIVEDVPTGDEVPGAGVLLGLYEGIPLPERGSSWAGGAVPGVPDRIVLFRRPIEARAGSDAQLAELVYDVVVHEIAHYFGFDDDELDRLGW